MLKPDNWTEEDRGPFAEEIVDQIMQNLTPEDMRRAVWDMLYDDIVQKEWSDLFAYADMWAPNLLEKFNEVEGAPA